MNYTRRKQRGIYKSNCNCCYAPRGGELNPLQIKELIRDLKKAGFVNRGGKGNHRNFKHPCGVRLTISGNPGHDAKRYQEREVEKALLEVKNEIC
ncbi:MAG: addiction module toxin, HicA family [Candidatus Aegiribacteria sp.]|nr:addiction module toxin, HicA family [Candidatus Aegiribacteria sp.]